jgi:hypothetical protein
LYFVAISTDGTGVGIGWSAITILGGFCISPNIKNYFSKRVVIIMIIVPSYCGSAVIKCKHKHGGEGQKN